MSRGMEFVWRGDLCCVDVVLTSDNGIKVMIQKDVNNVNTNGFILSVPE